MEDTRTEDKGGKKGVGTGNEERSNGKGPADKKRGWRGWGLAGCKGREGASREVKISERRAARGGKKEQGRWGVKGGWGEANDSQVWEEETSDRRRGGAQERQGKCEVESGCSEGGAGGEKERGRLGELITLMDRNNSGGQETGPGKEAGGRGKAKRGTASGPRKRRVGEVRGKAEKPGQEERKKEGAKAAGSAHGCGRSRNGAQAEGGG